MGTPKWMINNGQSYQIPRVYLHIFPIRFRIVELEDIAIIQNCQNSRNHIKTI